MGFDFFKLAYTLFILLCAVTSAHNTVVPVNYHAHLTILRWHVYLLDQSQTSFGVRKDTVPITDLRAYVTAQRWMNIGYTIPI